MKIDDFRGEHRWLSNFHLCPILYEGLLYPSTEHAYQAAKFLDFGRRRMIAALATCGKAKKAGQEPGCREDWDDVKVSVMRDVLRIKFQDPELMAKLKATAPAELVEGNTWNDTFWGVCNGVGQNWLGRLLMEIRDGEEAALAKF